ncbi:hypothetical protein AJ85_04835 [Alkalihalobacillus alcalophilus ATCC 27647 = CGMCC 1.3604]|uniref:Fimbrial assembly protein n=1 Tax=Alkalihalobacillus alcalophilus ATCC 27647 = CGMCC 1.3604 TaxID=1218173 RepID=A0A094WNR4_ALKAL|nr:hypothetical protein [Alkalihalobacillus alcalophilus]KGA97613.1 hypothetical protein BALCAV_0209170 [Alkalihalobacillus alcalophilus ATCC 27647 = CGMCC 1.3604]MED1561401.1 hypothetical protein [Alkalihalobacillus alcalophilus]THG91456.1 hypothetical protein AJ85_04835 [Alkalihalobacillus alcalophilus ATCC 27647 = CGMCC 1.3604]
MLEVNLLPEKRKRDITPLFIFLIVLLYIIFMLVFTMNQAQHAKTRVVDNQQLLNEVQLEITTLNQSSTLHISEEKKWNMAVLRLEKDISYVPRVMQEMVRLLPANVVFSDFQLNGASSIEMNVQFMQVEEMSAYQNELRQSEVVDEVWVLEVRTGEGADDPTHTAAFQVQLNQANLEKLGESK